MDEPHLKAEANQSQDVKDLEDKVFSTKQSIKRGRNGSDKVVEVDEKTFLTCGKKHKGECWLKDKSSNKMPTFGKKEKAYINKLMK